jgi:hypothetical protein
MIYLDRSELKAAEAFAKSAIEVFIEVFGAEHPATAMAMHQLGEVHLAQNKTEAARLQKQAAKVLAKTYGQYRSLHTDSMETSNLSESNRANLAIMSFDETKQTGISKN